MSDVVISPCSTISLHAVNIGLLGLWATSKVHPNALFLTTFYQRLDANLHSGIDIINQVKDINDEMGDLFDTIKTEK